MGFMPREGSWATEATEYKPRSFKYHTASGSVCDSG